jgi:hypothetical protein
VKEHGVELAAVASELEIAELTLQNSRLQPAPKDAHQAIVVAQASVRVARKETQRAGAKVDVVERLEAVHALAGRLRAIYKQVEPSTWPHAEQPLIRALVAPQVKVGAFTREGFFRLHHEMVPEAAQVNWPALGEEVFRRLHEAHDRGSPGFAALEINDLLLRLPVSSKMAAHLLSPVVGDELRKLLLDGESVTLGHLVQLEELGFELLDSEYGLAELAVEPSRREFRSAAQAEFVDGDRDVHEYAHTTFYAFLRNLEVLRPFAVNIFGQELFEALREAREKGVLIGPQTIAVFEKQGFRFPDDLRADCLEDLRAHLNERFDALDLSSPKASADEILFGKSGWDAAPLTLANILNTELLTKETGDLLATLWRLGWTG